MLKLEDIRPNAVLEGLEPGHVVTVAFTQPVGDNALTAFYKLADGSLRERMLFRADEAKLSLAQSGRPWAFDAPGEDFKLAAEAYRISLAHLFDPMMAVHTSNVEPLPHQISAVYESMLPRQPLRYVLADDPGAGKTIMAGLYIRELIMRADARRVLIVAPGSLVDQWREELFEKFGLEFKVFTNDLIEASHSGNPFEDSSLLICRVDQLSRRIPRGDDEPDDLIEKLKSTRWDLVVMDEAHKLSASYFGNKIEKTKRFLLAELLGSLTRHFLLMTATPHNGKEADFQLFMSLLDSDRFYGKFRDGVHKVDPSDLMRRMVKEQLVKFDGTPLFPERRAHTVNYKLSPKEADLYEAVTRYVKDEMGKADALEDGKRKGTVGFALTSLQRRLASSPEAIFRSLDRRHRKLKDRLAEEKLLQRARLSEDTAVSAVVIPDDEDDDSAEELEQIEDTVVTRATTANTLKELEAEIIILDDLVTKARELVDSGEDHKWSELSQLLQTANEMRDAQNRQRKLLIFTESKDTLDYLVRKVSGLLGDAEAVTVIHGSVGRDERKKAQESFRFHPRVRVLIATDAAGEGVNLQNANLMVNYDLPWNPNRLEQRFGRIHRIGQTEVCHLWNLVAYETREGEVFHTLFEKLERSRAALGGRVFDILGEVFEEKSLKDLLIDAIRYGDEPSVRARLQRKVEGALDTDHLRDLIKRNALCEEVMDGSRLHAVREEMDKAEARRLQPHFIHGFFKQAFTRLGGELRPCEAGRFAVPRVPSLITERDRQLAGRDRRSAVPVLARYDRICFEKKHIRVPDKASAPMASLVHPAHPLMQAVTDITLEQHRPKLKQGAILVDHADIGVAPRVCFLLDHAVKEGANPALTVSRRTQFVSLSPEGVPTYAGWAPHLDLAPIQPEDLPLVQDILNAAWITKDLEARALAHASTTLVPEHFDEVRLRREATVDKTLTAVNERLVREINYWQDRIIKLDDDRAAGKDVRLTRGEAQKTLDDLTARLELRRRELTAMRDVLCDTPVVAGGMLVIPAGLLAQRRGEPAAMWSTDAAARARIERLAMQAVMNAELARGHTVKDVSADKCGWDVTASPSEIDGRLATPRHIEVKGRVKGATTITVTRNEILYALNQADKFLLAVVLVGEDDIIDGPHYIRRPFTQEPDWAVTSINIDLADLLTRSSAHT